MQATCSSWLLRDIAQLFCFSAVSICNAGDLRPPRTPLRTDLVYTYKASADLPGALSYHLQDLAEAAIIAHEQVRAARAWHKSLGWASLVAEGDAADPACGQIGPIGVVAGVFGCA